MFTLNNARAGYVVALAVLSLAAPGPARAAPPAIEVPAEVRPAGEYVRFSPKTDAVSVTYVGLSGLDAFPSEELQDKKRFLLNVRGLPAGRYAFAAVAAGKTGEQTRADFVVIVGVPPVPPGPVPPVPPVPPAPVDPLVLALSDAYRSETSPDKRERLRALAAVMRFGAEFTGRADIKTNADLTSAVTIERKSQIVDALPEVRKAIGAHLAGQFDPGVFTLTAADRSKFKAAYLKLAAALDEVGK